MKLLEYDPEKTKRVNAWLSLYSPFKNMRKYFRYEIMDDWYSIIMTCKKTNTCTLHMWIEGRYWIVWETQ